MKYLVDLDGSRVEVVLDGGTATVDGVSEPAALADVEGTSVRLVTVGGVQHRVVARRTGPRDPGARRTRGPIDDSALHAPEPGSTRCGGLEEPAGPAGAKRHGSA